MGGQIENYIHVCLVEPEIQARAVKVEEPSKVTSAYEVTQLMDGRVVLEGVAGHENDAGGRGGIDEHPCLACSGRHGFFDKHVLPRRDCLQGERSMARRRCGDDERINMRQGIFDVRVCRDVVLRLPRAVSNLSEPLVHADDSGYAGRGPKHPDMSRTPVTNPYDADPDTPSSRPHLSPPVAAAPQPRSGYSTLVYSSLTYHEPERHPRMSGHTYAK